MGKVLFISSTFFDYYKKITEELENQGHSVIWFNERPNDNLLTKAIIRLNRNLIKSRINKHVSKIIEKVKNENIDKVLIILGESFSPFHIQSLKDSLPGAEFIFYMWDSIKNFPNVEANSRLFDKCFTFDRIDAINHKHFEHLPLFYSSEYETVNIDQAFENDIFYVGTANVGKYKVIKDLSLILLPKYKRQFIYLYMHSKLFYFYSKMKYSEFKKAKSNEFQFVKLSRSSVLNQFMRSKIILDAPKTNQIGLTMRTIECLGAGKKLITTNQDVINYDFYKPENIYIFDGVNVDFNNIFFTSNYIRISEEISKKYSITYWVKRLMSE